MHIRLIFLNLWETHDDGSWLAGTDGIVPLSGNRKGECEVSEETSRKVVNLNQ